MHIAAANFERVTVIKLSDQTFISYDILAIDSDKDLGTCYTRTECSDKNGIAGGNCAAGLEFLTIKWIIRMDFTNVLTGLVFAVSFT